PFCTEEPPQWRVCDPQRKLVASEPGHLAVLQRPSELPHVISCFALEPRGQPAVEAPPLRLGKLARRALADQVVGDSDKPCFPDGERSVDEDAARMSNPLVLPLEELCCGRDAERLGGDNQEREQLRRVGAEVRITVVNRSSGESPR